MSWINYSEYLEETLQTLREALKNYLQQEFSGLVDHIIGSLAGKLLKIAVINEVERLCSSVSSICASGFHESSDDEMTERLRKLTKLLNGKAVDEDRGELEETADISSIPRDSSDLQIEQRTRSAYTVFELEAEYKDKLNVLMNIYMKPLSSSIQSNRAIISNSSVKMIFSDCETLEKISSELVIDLKKRIDSWNSEQPLEEHGRYLLKEMTLSEMSTQKGNAEPNGPIYIHVRDVTLFLFNDILICTRRLSHLNPFKRSISYELKYESAINPCKLRVLDVPDTKYFNNAFTISFPERDWLVKAQSPEEKFACVSLLSETSSSALPLSCKLLNNR
eukprot:Seg1418.1 transcript_id=Seg1418.1/GoldUCD/mRNA.D3Y31 product="Epithelial cell-transforming sequence 2 oncogene-like" protein_id=Seg1418.1/GoldUCD/D3Y31